MMVKLDNFQRLYMKDKECEMVKIELNTEQIGNLIDDLSKIQKVTGSLERRLSRIENAIKFNDIKDPSTKWLGRNHDLAPVIGEYAIWVHYGEIIKEYQKKYNTWAKKRLSNPPDLSKFDDEGNKREYFNEIIWAHGTTC